jgi:hypothetical protein
VKHRMAGALQNFFRGVAGGWVFASTEASRWHPKAGSLAIKELTNSIY